MHQAGEEIIVEGYKNVVTISNYMDENRVFQTPAKDFVLALDFELQEADSAPWGQSPVVHYKGFECKWTIQDGELQGAGIYVFFKDATGANTCRHDFVDSRAKEIRL